ncbi:homeobox protein ceh-26, partial [Trichinella spiralis]|uniref:homeobox protein ceh-26 n=1 Tax=Trichinella spiralis TaxID=6334 RepID=UPI0001EFE0B4
ECLLLLFQHNLDADASAKSETDVLLHKISEQCIVKAFFPDIRFNKNNTAQLVKWFSNFR